ncbi:YdcF family protein [Enterobacter sp.]|uniref:YdcF family protein n=1 Tax=Enterobacter sp. TaxID=42895 RepID=UPI00296FB2F7|nr:YdcF family protein [Enterobacter sp.]
MINTHFPHLPEPVLAATNTLGRWLANNAFEGKPQPVNTDCVILAGNAVIPTIDAACKIAAGGTMPLLISGGVGHSTTFLYAAIARHPRYNALRTTGRSEAAILADIARQFWNIPADRILIEDKSTNCGENAHFSCELLRARGMALNTALVIQDPTMQRRTMATFARAAEISGLDTRWLSYPGVTPVLVNDARGLRFATPSAGLWPVERYLSLLMGEVPRLRDDEQGYGPRGRNFIVHVDFPAEIEAAWRTMLADPTLTATLKERALL